MAPSPRIEKPADTNFLATPCSQPSASRERHGSSGTASQAHPLPGGHAAAPPQARCAAEEQLEASRVHTQLLMKRVTEMERLRASVSLHSSLPPACDATSVSGQRPLEALTLTSRQ